MEQISYGTRKARKAHRCDGWHQIDRQTGWQDLADFPDHPCKAVIQKGQEYNFQVNKIDHIFEWKSCKSCNALISEHELYED